jgi:Tfp pilus assembly protein PilN
MLAGFNAQQVRRQHDLQQQQIQAALRLQQQRNAPVPLAPAALLPAPQIAAINSATEQLNLPWRDLLDAVEAATPKDIALLTLEPDGRKHILKGVAEARDSDAMLAYIEALQQQEFFSNVVLTRHDTNEQDARKPLRFQFEAQWSGGAP